jgi:hypothetical protein
MAGSRWSLLALVPALLAGCAEVDSINPQLVLPTDYRTRFVQVRGCRPSLDHMMSIVVRTPPNLALVYDDGPYPFPADSLVVAEQYQDGSCMSLFGYVVMKKEPGYDPANGDWHWYVLDDNLHVQEGGKITRCTKCHRDCSKARDHVCAQP